MKLQLLLLICLLPTASAAMAPSHVQTNDVAIYVDVETPANVTLAVGLQEVVLHDVVGRIRVEASEVPDGLHVWMVRIEYEDHVEVMEGVVSVLDVQRLIQSQLQAATQAAEQTRHESRQASQEARSAAEAAQAVQKTIQDLEVLLANHAAGEEERQAAIGVHEANVLHELAAHDVRGEASSQEVQEAVEAMDQGVLHLGLVVVFGSALLAWYVAQVRRNGLALYERALIRAVAARLKIRDDEVEEVLHALDLQERRQWWPRRGGDS